MFNGTKQNVVASSGYECLIWGVKETGPGEVKEENVTLERIHNSRASRGEGESLECGCKGFWMLRAPGTTGRKGRLMASSLLPIWGGYGSDPPSVEALKRLAILTLKPQLSTPRRTQRTRLRAGV